MGVGETITIINKSGKVVKSSRHIVDVFKEARSAYRERKAEITAERKAAYEEKKLSEGIKAVRIEDNDDTRSRASSRHSKHSKATHRSKSHRHHPRPPMERGYTDSFYANDDIPHKKSSRKHRFEQDLAGDAREGHRQELQRRHTAGPVQLATLKTERSKSVHDIDMDLAYGDIPPPLPSPRYDDGELREKASKLTVLLDEANCLQHSVTTMIDSLQKNPDALAAVALTLAEISTIVGKMGPAVLPVLKGSFPAVAALLISPQFMIAAGVGIGVTIVALGGFKIVKKIQAQKEEEKPIAMPANGGEAYQLDELETKELSRIELWRRGIADVEEQSAGTTVDGEFITPGASRHLVAAGVLDEEDLKSRRSARLEQDRKSHRAKSVKSAKSTTSRRSHTVKEGSTKSKKKKEPSGLRSIFRSHTMH
ncbi:hypothetical protein BU24DRAFT_81111 [Aaosphaeria arxii CBS 175.79]|uniref:Uncharacterized protein n=1 Tax=Aaosphaeria arxii CBS 175.79 TaxID=1450172 RepID=A0A6A5XAB1_9PLEO|nr:uncharacterized protein BU24DRAFT_81111 [Aaosphaeria arxii CBS 175.79]KAF2009707.1 hypothetical protein BU24DRAFT_81111 [Aaosphaeria arxii CBS 175.79]